MVMVMLVFPLRSPFALFLSHLQLIYEDRVPGHQLVQKSPSSAFVCLCLSNLGFCSEIELAVSEKVCVFFV